MRCLVSFTILVSIPLCTVAVSTKVVTNIQCAVCKLAVKEASLRAKEKHIEDEDALADSIENLCSASKDEGKWTTKIDIITKATGSGLALDKREDEGVCNTECKTVQRACSVALKGKEDDLASSINAGAGVGKLQREVCKKACSKPIPELNNWKDEPFVSSTPPPPPPPPPPMTTAERTAKFSSSFTQFLQAALKELGGAVSVEDIQACYQGHSGGTHEFFEETQKWIEQMMEKQIEAMRSALITLGGSVAALAASVESSCGDSMKNAAKMRLLGEKLVAYSKDTTSLEYKPLETLKVQGHDLHKQVNKFIAVWNDDLPDGHKLGQALGDVLRALEDQDENVAASPEHRAEL